MLFLQSFATFCLSLLIGGYWDGRYFLAKIVPEITFIYSYRKDIS